MLPEIMNTVEMREPGGPDVLVTGTRPLPIVGDEDVLIRIVAAGVNGPDLVQRRGHYPPPAGASDLLGLEVSGEVIATGGAVTRWQPGDRVCALTNGGGYADHVSVRADHCLPVPDGVSPVDAAGLCETGFTVWSNAFLDRKPVPESLFLVHGGAGGIGTMATQLGAALGLRVFNTCSSADAPFCRENGAERTIDYDSEDFVAIVREAGGASLILDIVGGDYIARNIKACAPDATLIQLAFARGSKVELDLMPLMLKRLTVTGSTLRSRPDAFKARVARDLESRVWPLFADGTLRCRTFTTLPFSEARRAHELLESGAHRGKILLTPD